MDSLGDIIFFGAIVIAIVSNVIKALRKNKPQVDKPVFTETALDDYDYQPAKEKAKPVTPPISFFEKERKTTIKDNRIKEMPTQEIQLQEEENTFNIDFSDVSEAKKAIIYSEIFHRKY